MQSQPTTTAKLSSVALVLAKPPTPKVPGPAILSDHQMVGRLLEAFGATDLGEGDPVAGANVLAAMAISLANVQRPGTGLVDKDGAKLSVGASLLVSDSLSVGLVGERVLSGLATCQNNFVAHLRDWQRSAARQIAKGPNTRTFDPAAVLEKGSSSALHYMHTNAGMSGLLDSGLCEALVIAPKGLGKRELHERPLVYITAAKPAELSKTLELSHLGRPFIHVGLHDAAACARFRECCTAVMDGTQTVGPMSETVRGCVVATTAPDTLAEVVRANGASATWLASMLWLTDSAAGPEPGDIPADKATVRLNSVQARYRKAMVEAWGERVNYVNTAHSDEAADWQRPQTEWISFLKGQEPELPGITGTALTTPPLITPPFRQSRPHPPSRQRPAPFPPMNAGSSPSPRARPNVPEKRYGRKTGLAWPISPCPLPPRACTLSSWKAARCAPSSWPTAEAPTPSMTAG